MCRHSTQYLVAASHKQRVKSRHEHLVLESLKLMDKALRHKPGSPTCSAAAAAVDPVDVVRGLQAAVSLTMTKVCRLHFPTWQPGRISGCDAHAELAAH